MPYCSRTRLHNPPSKPPVAPICSWKRLRPLLSSQPQSCSTPHDLICQTAPPAQPSAGAQHVKCTLVPCSRICSLFQAVHQGAPFPQVRNGYYWSMIADGGLKPAVRRSCHRLPARDISFNVRLAQREANGELRCVVMGKQRQLACFCFSKLAGWLPSHL